MSTCVLTIFFLAMNSSRKSTLRNGIALGALAVLVQVAFDAASTAPDGDGDGMANSLEHEAEDDRTAKPLDRNVSAGLANKGPYLGTFRGEYLDNPNPTEKDIDGDTLSDDALSACDMDGDGHHDEMLKEDDFDGDGYEDDDAAEMDTEGLWFNTPEELWHGFISLRFNASNLWSPSSAGWCGLK